MQFKKFLEIPDVKDTLEPLPQCFKDLIKGFEVKFISSDTLPHDKQNIGYIKNNKIVVSNPFYYSRQFTFLHEIGHIVWEKVILKNNLEQEWKNVLKRTKNKINQNSEEQFCHFFASHFSRYGLIKHSHPEYEKFLKKLTNLK